MPQKSDKIAIVTVHGTGDTATGLDGPRWFQRGSPFSERLKQRLAQDGVEAEIVPHLWSGANSAWERERGADKLAHAIRRLYDRYDTIHVVGHSHGGNVANDAAVLLKWGLRKNAAKERFDSLTTVGTPFFDVRTGWPHMIAGFLFLIIAWGSAIIFPLLLLYGLGDALQPHPESGGLMIWVAYGLIIGPCVLFMLAMSRAGIRRILRPRGGKQTKTSIFSIWHENDEAISFLRRVEELPVEAFPRGSLFRSSRVAAVACGVLAVIAVGLINPLAYAFHWADFIQFERNAAADADVVSNVVAVTVISLLAAPAVFTVIYFAYRWLIGGATEFGARGSMNRYVIDVLRGIAYGRDGDQVLGNVSATSHTHATEQHVLAGDIASRMQAGAHDAAGKLIDKYRWALFSVGGDSSASLTALTTDAMTWESLIHTTYFDQPEIADMIGDYIAAKAKGAAYAPVQGQPMAAVASVEMVAAPAVAPTEAPPEPVAHSEAPPPPAIQSEAQPAPSSEAHGIMPSEIPATPPEEPRPA